MSGGPSDSDSTTGSEGPPALERTDVSSPGVCLCWIDGGTTSGWFTWSLAQLITLDARLSQYVTGEQGDMIHLQSSPRIHEARNQAVDLFAQLEQQPEWLLMIDSDMTFEPDLLERMMQVADRERVPILGGLCFGGGRANDPFPTIYRLTQEDNYASLDKVYDYPRDTLVKVGATGAACLLVHRSVYAAMHKAFATLADGRMNPSPWFAEGVFGPKGESWGEDTAFCLRAHALQIPIHVHTGIKLGHVKETIIDEVYYDNRREVRRQDERVSPPPLHATRAERRRLARARAS